VKNLQHLELNEVRAVSECAVHGILRDMREQKVIRVER
jgi:hypothetical protein